MTPERLAALHTAAFTQERPWTAQEFASLLQSDFIELIPHENGFVLFRTVAGESELLTLAVHPDHQGHGIGRELVRKWLFSLEGKADTAFLEVAADNTSAILLYTSEDFAEIARRPAYYARKNAAAADAIVMQRVVTFGQAPDSAERYPESG